MAPAVTTLFAFKIVDAEWAASSDVLSLISFLVAAARAVLVGREANVAAKAVLGITGFCLTFLVAGHTDCRVQADGSICGLVANFAHG